jgi:nucleoid-associated protein EbfC
VAQLGHLEKRKHYAEKKAMTKGFGPMGQFQEALKRVKKIQEGGAKLQDELEAMVVEGSAGGGLVTVTLTGNQKPIKIAIDDKALAEGKEMVEDLVLAAYKDAYEKSTEQMRDRVKDLTGGMSIPGMNI